MHDKFVYFDLGNVLVLFDHEIAVSQLAELTSASPEKVRASVFESDLQTRFETGVVDRVTFANEINSALETSVSTDEICEAISAIFRPNNPILDALGLLQEKEIPMGILSNTCSAHWEWILDKQWPMIGDWFEHHVLSYEVGCMKPDSGIYEHSEKLAEKPSECIFFTDDRADNIAAASERGWNTHQFIDTPRLLRALESWLSD